MSARERILSRLRGAAPAVAPSLPDVHALYGATRKDSSRAERIAGFRAQMAFWRGEVVRVTAHNWTARLRELCAAKAVGSLLYGAHGVHGPALAATGMPGLQPYDRPIDEWKPELFENVDAGFTSARGAIAETGTLIVWPDAAEPRLISLVPPIHIALVDADNIHDTLFAAMTNEAWSGNLPTNALLISGPSKTADIQQTLAYGAHGPKELIVLLLVNEEEL
jgi:L-lactate dehydrogenase complex protein LldG